MGICVFYARVERRDAEEDGAHTAGGCLDIRWATADSPRSVPEGWRRWTSVRWANSGRARSSGYNCRCLRWFLIEKATMGSLVRIWPRRVSLLPFHRSSRVITRRQVRSDAVPVWSFLSRMRPPRRCGHRALSVSAWLSTGLCVKDSGHIRNIAAHDCGRT